LTLSVVSPAAEYRSARFERGGRGLLRRIIPRLAEQCLKEAVGGPPESAIDEHRHRAAVPDYLMQCPGGA
jgi:hypothetical protein